MFSDGHSLQTVMGDADDGLPPGFQEAMTAFVTAIRNNLLSGDADGARRAGEDLGVLLVALDQVVNLGSQTAERAARQRKMQRVGKNHYVAEGYVPVRKALAQIGDVIIDGERVPVAEVDFKNGRPERKQRRGK